MFVCVNLALNSNFPYTLCSRNARSFAVLHWATFCFFFAFFVALFVAALAGAPPQNRVIFVKFQICLYVHMYIYIHIDFVVHTLSCTVFLLLKFLVVATFRIFNFIWAHYFFFCVEFYLFFHKLFLMRWFKYSFRWFFIWHWALVACCCCCLYVCYC